MVATEKDVPEANKRRAVRDGLSRKRKSVVSKAKACEIMRDGQVHGKKLTERQRKFMGARCSGQPEKRRAA